MSTDVHATPHPDLETMTPSPNAAGAAPPTAIEEEITQPPEPSLLDFRHRITVDEYQRIADAGIFPDRAPIELLEGVLIQKMTIKPPHIISCELLDDVLHRLVPTGWYCSMGNPMQIHEDDSEPEPDAQVIRGGPETTRAASTVPRTRPSSSRWPTRAFRTTEPSNCAPTLAHPSRFTGS